MYELWKTISNLPWYWLKIFKNLSFFTAGYAFYNSYRNTNQNAWIYLTTGLYGSGVSAYIYLSIKGNIDMIYTFSSLATDELKLNFGLGLYLAGIFSFLLFLSFFIIWGYLLL